MPVFEPVSTDDTKDTTVGSKHHFVLKLALVLCTIVAICFIVAFAVFAAKADSADSTRAAVPSPSTVVGPCVSAGCVEVAARVLASLNQSVAPCDDFYQYACGGWIAANPIPDDKPSQTTFSLLGDKNQMVTRQLLFNNISTQVGAKASLLYRSCMDESAIDARGRGPLVSLFQSLNDTFESQGSSWDQAADGTALGEVLGRLHLQGVPELFVSRVRPDQKNSSVNSLLLTQGGLGLPDGTFYFGNTTSDPVLIAFRAYIAKSFELMGVSFSEARFIAARVLDFEISLAKVTLPAAALRDPLKVENPFTVASLQAECPAINWTAYFGKIYGSSGQVTDLVVATPFFFRSLSLILTTNPKSTLVEYLQAHALMGFGALLSSPFLENLYQFRKALYGIQKPARRELCLQVTSSLGFAIGEAFVQKQFSKEARQAAQDILSDVTQVFENSFQNVSWMDAPTQEAARRKAAKIAQKIGYPQWFDTPNGVTNYYSGLGPIAPQLFEGFVIVSEWSIKRSYAELFQLVDRGKWAMYPQDVNAYYRSSNNEIVFPAGILQPPFFSVSGPKALNYGGIGAVMGHEISHAFDDAGARYGEDGNLKQWWSPQSYDLFETQTVCIANQYAKYSVRGSRGPVQVNGNLTLGENIADNGGLRAAFKAYRSWVAKHGEESKLPGLALEPEKLFFLGYAQAFCANSRPEVAQLLAVSDPHSPAQYRINGAVSNSKEFAWAFQCQLGSKMNPAEKCTVW